MSRPVKMAIGWGLAMACGLWLMATQVTIHSELGDLLPEGTTATQRLLLTQVRTGVAGRLMLIAIEGGNRDEVAELSKALGERLRASSHFNFVGNGAQVLPKGERELLFRSRYLLSRNVGPDTFTVASLRAALEQRLDDLRSPLAPMIKETVPGDPTGEFLNILQAWAGSDAPAKHRGVWMSSDHSKALLVAETKAAGFDADAQLVIHEEIGATFNQLTGAGRTPARLVMSGPGVFAVEIKRTIEDDAWWLSTVAATLVLTFLYLSYRSVTLVLLSLIPLSAGIVAGMLAVQGWFGFIHGITLGFGITLLGLVDDYPIHLFSHLTKGSSAVVVMRAIWPTMKLGVLTTAIGFSSLLFAGFPALTQLGIFAVAGLLTAAGVTRWVLPILVPQGFAPRDVPLALVALSGRSAWLTPAIPAAVILATGALLWSDTPLWETDLASLSPVSEAKKRLDQQLRTELGAPDVRDLLVIEGHTEEEALQRGELVMPNLERLRGSDALAGYEIISRYLPSRRMQQDRQRSLPDVPALSRHLQEATAGMPFAPGLFAPFLAAVEAARTQPVIERTAFKGTALGAKMDSLLLEQHGQWLAVVPLRGVSDRTRLSAQVASWAVPGVAYVDLKEESNQLMTAYRKRTVTILGAGLLAIALILAVGLRSISMLGPVIVPILGALVVVTAIVNISGESLSLFHVATYLLVIGLGLDYALFFNRLEGTGEERPRTLYGLLVCGCSTILVFGILACSRIPVLHAIGMTAALGSACCLLFSGIMAKKETHETA